MIDPTTLPRIERGPLVVDPARGCGYWHGRRVQLTPSEAIIMHSLATDPGMIRTRLQLMDHLGINLHVYPTTIDCHIKRLRRKFAKDLFQCSVGSGYSLNVDLIGSA